MVAAFAVLVLAACGDAAKDTPGAQATLASERRPLEVPSIAPGTPCPTSKLSSQPSEDLGVMLGDGPARPVGIGPDGALDFVAASPENAYAGSSWGGNKVLWAVGPRVETKVLVRGRQLDGDGTVRFGEDVNPDRELVLPAPMPGERRLDGGWRDFPGATRIQHPGCYGYQVDTPTSSTVIVFLARPNATGIRIDPPLPHGWQEVTGSLYVDIGGLPSPRADATVATFHVPAEPSPVCDLPVAALERLGPTDAFISVVDAYPAAAYFNARPDPANFLPPKVPVSTQLEQGDADITPSQCLARGPDFRFQASGFTENNRTVQVYVALGLDASPTTEAQVLALLEQIVIDRRG